MSKLLLSFFTALVTFSQPARSDGDMNKYILQAVDYMVKNVSGRGYDINSTFTEDLRYGNHCCIPASNGGKTMCVAAVAETIIRSFGIYATSTGDNTVFSKLPESHWRNGRLIDIRAHLFQYREANSRGPGDAVSRFGIGEEKKFNELSPGDLVSFARLNGTGHSVVFLGYIDRDGTVAAKYSSSIVGFKYFSAQGKNRPDGGVGYRNAYFAQGASARCPSYANNPADCGLIKGAYLNAGRIWEPAAWKVSESVSTLIENYKQRAKAMNPELTKDALDFAVEMQFTKELEPVYSFVFE